MAWTQLPRGEFSGIDWAAPGATTGFDPYLVWAEASHFAGYEQGEALRWLPVLIELTEGTSIDELLSRASPQWLRVTPVYTSACAPEGLRYCTASIGRGFFKAIRPGGPLARLVSRFELGLPSGHENKVPPLERRQWRSSSSQQLKGKVLALIDGGLAFANTSFLRAGKARTRFFWRQDAAGVGPVPAAMGYGHELTAAEIDRAMAKHTYGGLVDEEAVYRHFGLHDLQRPINHGTHVMDIACGPMTVEARVAGVPPHADAPPSWALAEDDASRAPLIAVQLDWSNVVDTSGGSMNVSILDGIMYVLSRCAADAQVVVNISWGTLAGPHDGTSLLEAAMDQLIALSAARLNIAVPAGNSYQSRTHANARLEKGQSMRLNWKLLPDDRTASFLELWLSDGASGVQIKVTAPDGSSTSQWLAIGQSRMWTDESGVPRCALIYPKRTATGANGTCALLAMAPTFAFESSRTTAPCGVWTVELLNTASMPATVDAYIERDDVALGQHTGARQTFFEDALYDTSGNPGSFVDKPVPPDQLLAHTLIRRSGTFNSISTGSRTVSAGGIRMMGPHWALYSPRKPDPDASRPERRGVVKVPATTAFSDESDALPGVRAAGTLSSSVARLVGTSSATPQVARRIFNALRKS